MKDRLLSACRYLMIWALALFLLPGCGEENKETGPPPVRQVKTVVMEEAALAHHRSFPGKVQPTRQVDLSFRVAGPLIEFPVDQGQQVKKNQVLARIDPRDFETAVTKIQSSLDGAKAQLQAMESGARPEDLKVLEAEVEGVKANYRAAELDYKRVAELYQERASTKADLDRARSSRDVAKAQYESAVQNLEKGKKGARQEDIEAQQSNIAGLESQLLQARSNLEDTYLRAPFKGVVAQKYVQNYQDIQAKQAILNLQDLEMIEIVVQVPEQLIIRTTRTDKIKTTAVFDSLPNREFDMTFKEIATKPDQQTNTYPVTLKMPAPDDINLLPGMTAQVSVSWTDAVHEDAKVFKAPAEAVWADDAGLSYVWVVNPEDMTVHKRKVRVGELTGNSILLLEGVHSGDRLVVAGVQFLVEGQEVRLMDSGSEK